MLLTKKQVRELTTLSYAQINRLENPDSVYHDPTFPKRVRVGNRRVAWPKAGILVWIDERPASRYTSAP